MGDAVAHLTFGSFASWGMVKAQTALPCKRAEAPMLVLLTSGLTASIGEDWWAAVVPIEMWTVVWPCSPGCHAKGAQTLVVLSSILSAGDLDHVATQHLGRGGESQRDCEDPECAVWDCVEPSVLGLPTAGSQPPDTPERRSQWGVVEWGVPDAALVVAWLTMLRDGLECFRL